MADKPEQPKKIAGKELACYIVAGSFTLVGLLFYIFGLIGKFYNGLASDNLVAISEQAWLTNWSKMGKRRVDFALSVTYDTKAEQLEELLVRARSMLVNHPEIHPETIYVNLDSFGKDGFVIIFYFFTKKIT